MDGLSWLLETESILQAFPTWWLLVTTDAYGMRTAVAGTDGRA